MQTFEQHKTGDVVVTNTGRVMLITGEMEPMLYTAIEEKTGQATAIDATQIDVNRQVADQHAVTIRQQYMNRFFDATVEPIASFTEAMLGNRAGSHAGLLAELQHDVADKAGVYRSIEVGTAKADRALVDYVRALERHYQAVTKFNPENDDYQSSKHDEDTQEIDYNPCVFKAGGYCDCDDGWKDGYCSSDETVIRKSNQ